MSGLATSWLNRLRMASPSVRTRRFGRWALAVGQIAQWESELQKLDEGRLRKRSLDLCWRAKGGEPLRTLLVEAFALVREASVRTVGLRHYDVQMIGGMALDTGHVVEMETGEGKTLVATLPAYLNALTGRGVHIVTVNDYLAQRDADWMGPIYELLGLTVGCTQTPMGPDPRRKAYACDVTYGTAQEFGFDFLRDRLFAEAAGGKGGGIAALFGGGAAWSGGVQRRHHYAIVDEADCILIDEARTPLIISAPNSESDQRIIEAYQWADGAAHGLEAETHYTYDEEKNQVELTMEGRWKARALPMPDSLGPVGMEQIYEYAERAVKVHRDFHLDRHYVVQDGEIVIVDEFTGRLMPGRKWRDGVHQALEAKEGIEVTVATGQAARTTLQNYFLRYQKLAGMTGTAVIAARELRRVYRTPVVRVPTNRPLHRTILPDRIYTSREQRWNAVAEEVRRHYEQGRPVLIGTRSIDKSEHLSRLLTEAGIPHCVLNAKRHSEEAEIVAKAGQRRAITIATNMAGRGTDIVLGEGVPELGGLHVIGTERHDSARIDRQLAGRAGRQGDPGSAQFLLSLDDELLEAFGIDKAERLRKGFAGRNGQERIDRMRGIFRRAQRRVEKKHFKDRARLMRYEKQRNEMQTNMGLDPFLDSTQ